MLGIMHLRNKDPALSSHMIAAVPAVHPLVHNKITTSSFNIKKVCNLIQNSYNILPDFKLFNRPFNGLWIKNENYTMSSFNT